MKRPINDLSSNGNTSGHPSRAACAANLIKNDIIDLEDDSDASQRSDGGGEGGGGGGGKALKGAGARKSDTDDDFESETVVFVSRNNSNSSSSKAVSDVNKDVAGASSNKSGFFPNKSQKKQDTSNANTSNLNFITNNKLGSLLAESSGTIILDGHTFNLSDAIKKPAGGLITNFVVAAQSDHGKASSAGSLSASSTAAPVPPLLSSSVESMFTDLGVNTGGKKVGKKNGEFQGTDEEKLKFAVNLLGAIKEKQKVFEKHEKVAKQIINKVNTQIKNAADKHLESLAKPKYDSSINSNRSLDEFVKGYFPGYSKVEDFPSEAVSSSTASTMMTTETKAQKEEGFISTASAVSSSFKPTTSVKNSPILAYTSLGASLWQLAKADDNFHDLARQLELSLEKHACEKSKEVVQEQYLVPIPVTAAAIVTAPVKLQPSVTYSQGRSISSISSISPQTAAATVATANSDGEGGIFTQFLQVFDSDASLLNSRQNICNKSVDEYFNDGTMTEEDDEEQEEEVGVLEKIFLALVEKLDILCQFASSNTNKNSSNCNSDDFDALVCEIIDEIDYFDSIRQPKYPKSDYKNAEKSIDLMVSKLKNLELFIVETTKAMVQSGRKTKKSILIFESRSDLGLSSSGVGGKAYGSVGLPLLLDVVRASLGARSCFDAYNNNSTTYDASLSSATAVSSVSLFGHLASASASARRPNGVLSSSSTSSNCMEIDPIATISLSTSATTSKIAVAATTTSATATTTASSIPMIAPPEYMHFKSRVDEYGLDDGRSQLVARKSDVESADYALLQSSSSSSSCYVINSNSNTLLDIYSLEEGREMDLSPSNSKISGDESDKPVVAAAVASISHLPIIPIPLVQSNTAPNNICNNRNNISSSSSIYSNTNNVYSSSSSSSSSSVTIPESIEDFDLILAQSMSDLPPDIQALLDGYT